ncbi:hypothetical protein [Caulobacter sp. RL271]|jgi:hypothetical protein|uniref:Uncharacterized protein n=1 Tax=Caulobacter segnis TaxID=88688 RepID=A0ABY4ZZS9_9CAUL|nr:hypothetical protein [Caulobacter segnis]USQ98051.1 hypothetical protein MZV50_11140 [Caulobacter segnis]
MPFLARNYPSIFVYLCLDRLRRRASRIFIDPQLSYPRSIDELARTGASACDQARPAMTLGWLEAAVALAEAVNGVPLGGEVRGRERPEGRASYERLNL